MVNDKNTVYVGGLADEVNEKLLTDIFITFGDITEIQVILKFLFCKRLCEKKSQHCRCQSTTKVKNIVDSPSSHTSQMKMLHMQSTT